MVSHKFHIGQLVELDFAINRNAPSGPFEIRQRLPETRGEIEYRIKSMGEACERVARESELRAVKPG